MLMKRLNTKGDTIVEVLLAIAVVSAVLGGAFVATNRSLNGVRQSQERGEALKLVEGQLERLKEAAATDTSGVVFTTPTDPFCLNDGLAVQSPGSAVCNQGPDGRYRLEIDRSPPDDDVYTFTASARWERLGGGTNEVLIRYKTYRPVIE